uniref:Ceramide synthase 5 n=1 Tax=Mus musculus TaxID=10090 RepID=H3BJQ0_MOUSE
MATAAAETLGLLWGWLWSESFWLPQNVSWADLEGPGDGYGYPRAQHVLSVFPLAVCIFSVRMLFERFIAKPCALRVGIKDSPVNKVEPNDTLEKVFVSVTKYPDEKRLKGLSKQLDWSVRKIQCWFRHRRNQDKPPTLTKFCESMWRFTYYLCIFCYGIRFLWSDFLMMFIHHMIGIMLTTFSYVNNMVRVGALIFCLHDFADPLLEAAKMANYARRERLCTTLFVIFGAAFIVSRLAIFPLWCSMPSGPT